MKNGTEISTKPMVRKVAGGFSELFGKIHKNA